MQHGHEDKPFQNCTKCNTDYSYVWNLWYGQYLTLSFQQSSYLIGPSVLESLVDIHLWSPSTKISSFPNSTDTKSSVKPWVLSSSIFSELIIIRLSPQSWLGVYSGTVTMASHNSNNLSNGNTFSLTVELTEPYFGFTTTRALDGSNLDYTNVYPAGSEDLTPVVRDNQRESLGYDDGTENGTYDEWHLNCVDHTHIQMVSTEGYLTVHENTTIDNNSFKKVYMSTDSAIEKNLETNNEINMQVVAFKEENGAQVSYNYYFPIDNTPPTMVVDI